MIKKKQFCTECGSECKTYTESAEGWQSPEMILMSFRTEFRCNPTYSKFNSKGEPNMMQVYECPNRKVKKWWGTKTLDKHTKNGVKIGKFYQLK